MATIPLLLLPVVPEFILGYGSVATGYADFPLSVVWLCTVVHLLDFSISGSRAACRFAAVSAMFLPFVKNDGFIALCCITLTLAPSLIKNRSWRAGAEILGPAFAVWLGWRIFLRLCQVKPAYLLPLTWSTLVSHLDRTRTISQFVAHELIASDRWGILWPMAIASGAFLLIQRSKFRCAYPLVMNALLPVLLYPCVFFFSAYSSVQVHLNVAFSRLLIHNGLNAVLLISTAAILLFKQERTPSPGLEAEAV